MDESKKGDKIVFVGDGINDAPVLARVVQMSKCSNSQQLTVNNHSGATRIDIEYTF
jgi:3-deoxy-D-manno-octulosonate 8-phosphate phosphatase KdsC-like HAD superfamily phosphatase